MEEAFPNVNNKCKLLNKYKLGVIVKRCIILESMAIKDIVHSLPGPLIVVMV